MLILLAALQCITLSVLVVLLLRKPAAPLALDPRLAQLPDQIPAQLARLEAQIRAALTELRADYRAEAHSTRQAADTASATLRSEITGSIATLGQSLATSLDRFREDNTATATALRNEVVANLTRLGQALAAELAKFGDTSATSAEKLRTDVEQRMRVIAQGFADFKHEVGQGNIALQESLNAKLVALMGTNTEHQDKLRASVEDRLEKLNQANTAKLEEMRRTVDEKLEATLQTRLTESFGQVTTHLGEVQKGLGEMKELATGVGDLKKIFSNVKSRGGVGEFLVGQQLEQMFSPEQFLRQVNIKPTTKEVVDFALKFPNGEPGSFVLLPIDAKFPREDWERLEHAYEHGGADEIADAGKAFERAIRAQGKSIGDKYIDPPTTMPHAIMVLPTESLYAEVVRRPGLQSELQQSYRVTIAGPSTFMAILTSFQMGFHTLAIQKKGDEVWRVLSRAKGEFEKFGGLMDKVEKQVGTVQSTLREINSKTTTINRALKNVATLDAPTKLLAFEEATVGLLSQLAATTEDA
jgi:DNA recombination protein RmuC